MKRILVGLSFGLTLLAQDREPVDLTLIGRIKTETFENSRVMDTMGYLTEVYGARLPASPGW